MKLNRKVKSKLLRKQFKEYKKEIRGIKDINFHNWKTKIRMLKKLKARKIEITKNFKKVIIYKIQPGMEYRLVRALIKLSYTKNKMKFARSEKIVH